MRGFTLLDGIGIDMNKICNLPIWPLFVIVVLMCLLNFPGNAVSANPAPKKQDIKPVANFYRTSWKQNPNSGFAFQGIRKRHMVPDYLLASVTAEPEKSRWFESEKAFYTEFLNNRSYDVLVVPFQTQIDGVDPIGRMLMSYQLAAEIEKRTDLKVAPLPLVSFALGSHLRFVDDEEVYVLAEKMGVSHIVWGYAGTNEDPQGYLKNLDIKVVRQAKEYFGSPQGTLWYSYNDVDLSSNELPSTSFEKRLPTIIKFLNFTNLKPIQKTIVGTSNRPDIPKTPQELFAANPKDPISKSYYYQFMGMLISPRAELHRQYMFIRSLIALTEADPKHPDYAVLKARAYYHLFRRPAAIRVLAESMDKRAVFLRMITNGSRPDIEAFDVVLKSGMDGFFATVELSWIMKRYKVKMPPAYVDRWIERYPEWAYLFQSIIDEQDPWVVPNNIGLKQILDKVYPIEGMSLPEIVEKWSSNSDRNSHGDHSLDLKMAFQAHLRKSLPRYIGNTLSGSHTSGPTPLDRHIMLEGIGTAHLIRYLRFYSHVQGLPERAMDICKAYLRQYRGHPYFTLMYANIRRDLAFQLKGEEKQRALEASVQNAALGMWWYGRQGWAYREARRVLQSKTARNSKLFDRIVPKNALLYGIAGDYPLIPRCARTGNTRPYETLIEWSSWDIVDLNRAAGLYSKTRHRRENFDMMTWLKEQAVGRFIGHPKRHNFELVFMSYASPIVDKKRPYIEMIEQGSNNWDIYYKLGLIYVEEGAYQNAKEVFLSYPEFVKQSAKSRVALSNHAYESGSLLFWKGAYKEALPLYQYAADLNTGSNASLTSQARVSIIEKDFSTAADYMLRRAERYETRYGYRDYMSLAHILGDSNAAWDQFSKLIGRYSVPDIWLSAGVGHRIQQTNTEELKSWISDLANSNETSRKRSFPARFAFMSLVDRKPDIEMAEFVETVDDLSKYNFKKPFVFLGPKGRIIGPEMLGSLHYRHLFNVKESVMPKVPPKELRTAHDQYYQEDIPKEPFSFYGSLARAYENIKLNRYKEAFEILKHQSYLYSYWQPPGKPVKPYLVWAGMNSGNEEDIEHFLTPTMFAAGIKKVPGAPKASPGRLDFDDHLSLAAYYCRQNKDDLAIGRLTKAFAERPHTEIRPLCSFYQLVEMCEWFYHHSNDRRYLDLALKWAKGYQVIAPMYAWSFAFEAKHAGNEEDRMWALGYALYLDEKSWRIAHFSDVEKKKAKKWFKSNNPFRKSVERRIYEFLNKMYDLLTELRDS